jgi:hypothetical protein
VSIKEIDRKPGVLSSSFCVAACTLFLLDLQKPLCSRDGKNGRFVICIIVLRSMVIDFQSFKMSGIYTLLISIITQKT